jgi:hypothetical protein
LRCDECINDLDNCASWEIRLTEVSKYCENFETNFDCSNYWFSEGENMWYEMSYARYTEDCLDYGTEEEWELFLEESEY